MIKTDLRDDGSNSVIVGEVRKCVLDEGNLNLNFILAY